MKTLHTPITRTIAPRRWTIGSLARLVLDRIVAADQAYRARQHLRGLSDDHLRDVGLTRRDAETGGR